jgi:uncharacterized membrane protein YfcA
MMDLTATSLLASTGAVTLGAALQAATGLGAGLVIVPLLALISLAWVPGPVIFASLFLSGLMAYGGRRHIGFARLPLLLLGLGLGMAAGAYSLAMLPLGQAGVLFGALILLAVALSFAGLRLQFTPATLLGVGTLSGFMGTTAAVGAPPLAILYQYEPGQSLRATLAFLYLVSALAMLGALRLAGRFGFEELVLGLHLVPGFVLGYFAAQGLAAYLDRGYSRLAVLVISSLSALALIVKSLVF